MSQRIPVPNTGSKLNPIKDKGEYHRSLWDRNHPKVIPSISMNPFPHTMLEIIPYLDIELKALQDISNRRRSDKPKSGQFKIRRDPIPNILSQFYQPTAIMKRMPDGALFLPAPSILKSVTQGKKQPDSIKLGLPVTCMKRNPYEGSCHNPPYRSKYDGVEFEEQLQMLLIQKPITIYMQQRKERNKGM